MRVFTDLMVLVTDDDEQEVILSKIRKVIDDSDASRCAEHQAGKLVLAAAASDIVVPFGTITAASMVLVWSLDEFTVKLSGAGQTAHPIRPVPAEVAGNPLSIYQKEVQPGELFLRGRVTSLHLGNPSGVDAISVYYVVVGEAAA